MPNKFKDFSDVQLVLIQESLLKLWPQTEEEEQVQSAMLNDIAIQQKANELNHAWHKLGN